MNFRLRELQENLQVFSIYKLIGRNLHLHYPQSVIYYCIKIKLRLLIVRGQSCLDHVI